MKLNLTYPKSNLITNKDFYCDQINDYIKSEIKPANGINLTNLYDPISVNLPADFSLLPNDYVMDTRILETDLVTNVISDVTDERLALTLYTNFNGSFHFGSFNASLDKTRILNQKSTSFIVSIRKEFTYESIRVREFTNDEFDGYFETEVLDNTDELRKQFFLKFGTHYISSIKTGFYIEILATCNSRTETDITNFRASMNAWGFGGRVESDSTKFLKQDKTEIKCRIKCGTISDKNIYITGFDQVDTFLKELNSGEITITGCPISFTAKTYESSLQKCTNAKDIYKSVSTEDSIDDGISYETLPYRKYFRNDKAGIFLFFQDIRNDNGMENCYFQLSLNNQPFKEFSIKKNEFTSKFIKSSNNNKFFKTQFIDLIPTGGNSVTLVTVNIFEDEFNQISNPQQIELES